MCDIDGLLTTTRNEGNLDGHKKHYAKNCQPMKDLGQVVKEVKPTVNLSSCHFIFYMHFTKN